MDKTSEKGGVMDNAYDMGRKRGQEESRKEIEQLRKEREWLLNNTEWDRPNLLKEMQKALKEE